MYHSKIVLHKCSHTVQHVAYKVGLQYGESTFKALNKITKHVKGAFSLKVNS